MPFYRWDEMKRRNLVKTTDSEGSLVLGKFLTATRQVQPPGKVTRPHTHGCEQMLQVVEGEGWFCVGEEEKTVGAGEIVHIPEGTLHELQNRGEIPLVYLSFKNRSDDWPPPEAIQD